MPKDTPKKKREFGVILESIESKVQHIVEAVDTHTKQLERLEPMPETLEQVKVDVDAMKTTLEGHTKQLSQLEGVPDKLDKIETRLDVIETTLEGTESEKPLKQRVEELEAKAR